MRLLVHYPAEMAWPHAIIRDALHSEHRVGARRLEPGHGEPLDRHGGPVLAAGQAAGEDAYIVGVVGDGERYRGKVVERDRRAERRDDPAVLLGDDADRRDVHLAAR